MAKSDLVIGRSIPTQAMGPYLRCWYIKSDDPGRERKGSYQGLFNHGGQSPNTEVKIFLVTPSLPSPRSRHMGGYSWMSLSQGPSTTHIRMLWWGLDQAEEQKERNAWWWQLGWRRGRKPAGFRYWSWLGSSVRLDLSMSIYDQALLNYRPIWWPVELRIQWILEWLLDPPVGEASPSCCTIPTTSSSKQSPSLVVSRGWSYHVARRSIALSPTIDAFFY